MDTACDIVSPPGEYPAAYTLSQSTGKLSRKQSVSSIACLANVSPQLASCTETTIISFALLFTPQCHLVNIWTKSDVPLTGVHPSCWLQPAILLGLFYLKTLHLKIHFHGNYCFFQQKTQMDGVEPFLSGGLTILFDFFAEFYIST